MVPSVDRALRVLLLLGFTAGACQPVQTPAPTSAPTPTSAPSVTASRVDVLNAANAAYQRGDANAAAELYLRVINTPPAPGEDAATAAAVQDFADFRGMVALLAAGREDEARARLDDLQSRGAGSPFARLGAQLWDQYGMTGQLRGACAQVQPSVATQAAAPLAVLAAAGVTIDASAMCSVPTG